MTRQRFHGPGCVAIILTAVACGGAATAPSTELLSARNAYSQARNGEAVKLNPTGVHDAAEALQKAEAIHKDEAGSQQEKNYAYIALRKSELAIAGASEALARQEQQRADDTYKQELEQKSEQASQESTQFAQQLTQTQQQLQQNTQSMQQSMAQLQQAQAELRKAEAVREEEGRTIISLSGVLFEPGGATLSSLAERRLDTVARALGAYADRPILVEGYTDAQGSDSTNQVLSQRRAEAVRGYLEQRGVDAGRIRAVGKGESNPVASNDTAEGRANNRRVEIIIDRESGTPSSRESSSDVPGNTDQPRPSSTQGGSRVTLPNAAPAPNSMPRTTPPAEEPAIPRE